MPRRLKLAGGLALLTLVAAVVWAERHPVELVEIELHWPPSPASPAEEDK